MYELIFESSPKARKTYRCIWCGEVIENGEKHRHEISKYEGNLQDHRWHDECTSAASEFFHQEGGESDFEPYVNERGQREES